MKQYVTVGLGVLVGAALFETALIPGLLIGGVAVLAPRYLPKGTLPKPAPARRNPGGKDRSIGEPARQATAAPQRSRWSARSKHPAQIRHRPGGRQDHHLPDHRHRPRFHHQLPGDRRIGDGGRACRPST